MMKASHLWEFKYFSHLVWFNGPGFRGVFGQPYVSPASVIVLKMRFPDPSQMAFSKHDHVIQAVTPDGSNQF